MNNISPTYWGPSAWKFLECVVLAYPDIPTEQNKNEIKEFFLSLRNALPCEMCREHYKTNLEKYKLNDNVLSSREKLLEWLVSIHNEVRKSNGQKQLTKNDVLKFHSGVKINYGSVNKTMTYLLFLSIVVLLVYAYKKTIQK
jgi:hypothetical protein